MSIPRDQTRLFDLPEPQEVESNLPPRGPSPAHLSSVRLQRILNWQAQALAIDPRGLGGRRRAHLQHSFMEQAARRLALEHQLVELLDPQAAAAFLLEETSGIARVKLSEVTLATPARMRAWAAGTSPRHDEHLVAVAQLFCALTHHHQLSADLALSWLHTQLPGAGKSALELLLEQGTGALQGLLDAASADGVTLAAA